MPPAAVGYVPRVEKLQLLTVQDVGLGHNVGRSGRLCIFTEELHTNRHMISVCGCWGKEKQ